MTDPNPSQLSSAIMDFHRARNQAVLKEMLARFTGKSTELLSYEEVRQKLKAQESSHRGLRDIPLDSIVGSVGRYTDFTRDFLPRQESSADRWARIKVAATDLAGLPPIEVYKIGEAYFVKDGNHRVSVARQLGATHIQAYVTELRTRVPFTPDIQPDDLIVKAEYAAFLEHTRLNDLRPEADLSVTIPGQYQILEEHISVHRYFMGIEQQREIPYEESAMDWYDWVYLPVARMIRERGILHYFPNRTETDLYLWIAEHRAALEADLGWEIRSEYVIQNLVDRFGESGESLVSRLGGKFLEILPRRSQENGSHASQWRKASIEAHPDDRMFQDILVPVNGQENGWFALEQAFTIARREGARLHGLHVVGMNDPTDSPEVLSVQAEYNRRCAEAGIQGELIIESGEISARICARANWTDLVVTNLAFPPSPQPLARLDSGFYELIQRCPRPLMAVPQATSPMGQALLAYDGSPKAEEALFVATYLAGHWQIPLTVVTVFENGHIPQETLLRAAVYLEKHHVTAETIAEHGPAAEKILQIAKEKDTDLLIMGGYGYGSVLEVVLGSVVDRVLRECHRPMLICH
jgi:nucleotide-binding universal stress UspA family protein